MGNKHTHFLLVLASLQLNNLNSLFYPAPDARMQKARRASRQREKEGGRWHHNTPYDVDDGLKGTRN
uniref:Putative secreted protein n=1 Tax=Anopheles marajoara TaxID=58244 RepID=A0A2M4CFS9_9DIPT